MKTRKYDWYDMEHHRPLYGIQVRWDGEWLNAAEDGKPLLFHTQELRDAKRKEINKRGTVNGLIRKGAER
jgi:hypothetical protein